MNIMFIRLQENRYIQKWAKSIKILCLFVFVAVKTIKIIEKYAAWKLRALFWRNGRPFKVKKENVEEPDNIDEIDFNEKEMIDKMADWYKKQQQK